MAGLLAVLTLPVVSAQEEAVKLQEIPQNFELWQDGEGFLWQLTKSGGLGSGDTSYFQAALALFIKGQAFAADSGQRFDGGEPNDEGAHVELGQDLADLKVVRDVWFDRDRSAVRVLDTFENKTARRITYRIDLKTAYQNPWQDLHGSEGRILGASPGSGLGPRDFGVLVKFGTSEGRHDTLFVTSSERDAQAPMISYSSNLRELTFSYDLDIEPGKKAALLHWVVQRNLQVPGDAEDALRPLYQRRQLIDPRVADDLVASIRNFDAQSFPKAGTQPFDLEGMVSLNAVLEPLGVVRRSDDVLWISPENQLAGVVNEKATLRVKTAWGEHETSIAKVAAIQGGGGLGRTPRVFLRDGRVWSGAVTATDLTMKIAEGWEVEELRPEELNLLMLRVGADDGRPTDRAGLFVELRTGDVLAIGGESAALKVLTPWGEDEVPLKSLRELHYATGSVAPRFRLLRDDGSLLTVFLGSSDLTWHEVGAESGAEAMVISPVTVSGAWQPGHRMGKAGGDMVDEWFDLDDAASSSGGELPESAVLLSGNNLLSGTLAMESLNLVSGAAVTPIDPAEIVSMRRALDSDSEASPSFEIELNGGELLTGRLRERLFIIVSGEKRWRVPANHFIAYRKGKSPAA